MFKLRRKILTIPLGLLLATSLIACGSIGTSSSLASSSVAVDTYSITFNSNGGSAVDKITENKDTKASKPTDPTKADSIFDGWYTDSVLSQSVQWPVSLTKDVTLYAKWTENRDFFLTARDETVNANQYEYDFNLDISTKFGPLGGLSAITEGNVKYNSTLSSSFLKTENNSGSLISDGKIYTVKTGDQLATIKVNLAGKPYDYSVAQLDAGFKYESSSFAKALFTFARDQIQTVTAVDNGKYEIKFSGSTTGYINTALKILNSPIVQQFIDVPETSSDLHAYVSFENGKIKTFEYDFTIGILMASITFHYDLTFTKVGSGVAIDKPTFNGVALTTEAINGELGTIKTALDAYKTQTNSGYTYLIDTAVDYPDKYAINSTTQGRTMRLVEGEDVYFWNRIKFESDYGNTDLYKSRNIINYERYRVAYANKDVYDVTDNYLFANTFEKLEGYDNHSIDEFYFLLPDTLLNTTNVSIITKAIDDSSTTYSIGLTSSGILSLLNFVDDSIRVDVNQAGEVVIYNVESGLAIKSSSFEITVQDGKISNINIAIKGSYVGAYADTIFSGACTFSLDYVISANDKGNTYVAPTENSEVDLADQ